MGGRETLSPKAGDAAELRAELERAYRTLSEITSRLLLTNEAAEAALSSHERTELCERFLITVAQGTGIRRAALFLAEPNGFSVGATHGLDEAEVDALATGGAEIEACRAAMKAQHPLVLDPDMVTEEARVAASANGEAGGHPRGKEEAEEEEEEEQEKEEERKEEERPAGEKEASLDEARFAIYLPVHLEEQPSAVLALGERVGGGAYDADDLAFLRHVMAQFAVAAHRSTLLEQNAERLRELDALVRVSREITSTLDLDAVLRAVVNTVSAVLENDRAEIALLRGGRLTLRAVSGLTRLEPDQAEIFGLEPILQYQVLHPARLQIAADDLGGDPEPPGAEIFGDYFGRQQMRAFMALPLRDDQGLLGFLCIESRQDAWAVQPAEGDTLDILAAQTTVAIRNATLYSEIPLRGVALPVSRARARLGAMSPRARTFTLSGIVLGLLLLLLPVFPERAGGRAVIRPLRVHDVRALTEGVVARVLVRGGDEVRAGQPLAMIEDLDLADRMSRLEGSVALARREVAAARQAGDASAWRAGQIRLAALERSLDYERARASGATLAAPFAGRILELDLAQRVGQHLEAGETFCTVSELDRLAADVEVDEVRVARIRPGQTVTLKVSAFPTRTFRGRVIEVGWRGRPAPGERSTFLLRAEVPNPERRLRPGMNGRGKVTVARRALAALAIDPLVRALQLGWW